MYIPDDVSLENAGREFVAGADPIGGHRGCGVVANTTAMGYPSETQPRFRRAPG